MKIRLARPIQPDSIVDGEGIRTVIWTQGCAHHCEQCHNPETHDFEGGFVVDTEELKKQLVTLEGQDGITLSGGDPLFQPQASLELAKFSKNLGLNVWCYTGFMFEQLQQQAEMKEILENIDILVDGKFEKDKKSLNLYFKGSKNQRIINVKESLKQGKAIEVEKYKKEKTFNCYTRDNNGIYI